MCELCPVVCEDFELFQSSPMCGPCAVWGLVKVSKFPCVWDFVPVLERLSFHKNILVLKVASVLGGLAKGTVIPYEVENVIPWGGYTVTV